MSTQHPEPSDVAEALAKAAEHARCGRWWPAWWQLATGAEIAERLAAQAEREQSAAALAQGGAP